MSGVQRVFHVAADYRLWARNPQDIYDSNVGGTKNLLSASKTAGVERLVYTSTVATIAVDRPQLPNEFTDSRLDEVLSRTRSGVHGEGRRLIPDVVDLDPCLGSRYRRPVGCA